MDKLKSEKDTCHPEWVFSVVDTMDKFGFHYCEIFEAGYISDIHIHPCISGERLKLGIKVRELSACSYHGAAVFTS